MVKKIQISKQEIKREKVAVLLEGGVSRADICRIVGVTSRTISNIKKRLRARRHLARKRGSGRRNRLQRFMKIRLTVALKKNPFLSCGDLRKLCNLSVSIETIRRRLLKAGFRRRRPRGQLSLLQIHKDQRWMWAGMHPEFYGWEHTVWTDECGIFLNDNGHLGWFHGKNDHPMSLDMHCGKKPSNVQGEQQRLDLPPDSGGAPFTCRQPCVWRARNMDTAT
jgi:transposase